MATGGCDRSVDSGVTCSICMEPYRGRQPKLLPCSHTFCLPCLTQIADKERKRLRQTTSDEEEVDVSITCPTCRSPVTLPPTGVAGLLTNVYLDDSGDQPDPRPFLCDLCEEGQEAKLTCGTCLTYFCTRCRRMHDKLCKSSQVTEVTAKSAKMSKVKVVREQTGEEEEDGSGSQIEMMEAFLKKMKETGKRSSQQKLTSMSRGVKDESAQQGQSTKNLESKVDLLTNLVTSLQNQVTMLCRDQTSLHEKHDREMTSMKTAIKKDRDLVTSLEREVAKLRDKNAILCQDKEQLRNDITNLQSDVTRVREYVNTLQVELDKLQGEQGTVQSDIAALRAEQGKDQAELNTLKAEQGKDQTELKTLKTELNTMKAEQGKDQAELKSLKTELNTLKAEQCKNQGEQNSLKSNAAALKREQGKLHSDLIKVQSNVQTLTAQPKVSKKQVAFHANPPAGAFTLKQGETLICNDVVSSVGGGFDNKTGVFTVPLSGLYCFIATTRCGVDDLNEWCCLRIDLDNTDIASVFAYGKTFTTAHAAIHATAGQKVFLRSFKNENKVYGGWHTSFSGFLIQPDF